MDDGPVIAKLYMGRTCPEHMAIQSISVDVGDLHFYKGEMR